MSSDNEPATRTPGLKERCAKRCWASDMPGGYMCSRKPNTFENGEWWCWQHLPSAVVARRVAGVAVWREKWNRQRDAEVRQQRILDAHDGLVGVLKAFKTCQKAIFNGADAIGWSRGHIETLFEELDAALAAATEGDTS